MVRRWSAVGLEISERQAVVLEDFPFWAVWIFFLCGALVRGQTMYWLGRGAAHGIERTRHRELFHRGSDIIERLGTIAVPLAYLTIGVQSAILFAAGVMKMGLVRYTVAQIPGVIAWATIYSTIGMAGWKAMAGSWWALGIIIVAIAVGIVWWALRKRGVREPES